MNAERRLIHTKEAPEPVGPYSQAVVAGDYLFSAGQIGIDPATGMMAGLDVESQTRQVIKNLEAVLEAAGVSLQQVVKTTIYLTDLDDFALVNEIYGGAFSEASPARSTVEVSRLPLSARVEMDVVALLR
jgi:2-iminobutanoate/2-iminopropanoate deaminase